MGKLPVYPSNLLLRRRRLPIDRAEKNFNAIRSDRDRRGNVRLNLDGILDGGDDDGVFHDSDNDAAGGEVGDEFFGGRLLGLLGAKRDGREERNEHAESEKRRAHKPTLPQNNSRRSVSEAWPDTGRI
jgi:hypothetical protein